MTSLSKKRPVYEIELPGFIKVSVWKRLSKEGTKAFYNYGPSRGYKTEAGQWKNSSTFSVEEWNAILPALERAREYVEACKAADARQQVEAELGEEE